jgi:hypothetical protein
MFDFQLGWADLAMVTSNHDHKKKKEHNGKFGEIREGR